MKLMPTEHEKMTLLKQNKQKLKKQQACQQTKKKVWQRKIDCNKMTTSLAFVAGERIAGVWFCK